MPDVRRQDAALAVATTVWRTGRPPIVLPLTVALAATHGARLLVGSPYPRLSIFDTVAD